MVRPGVVIAVALLVTVAVTLLLAFGPATTVELPIRDVALRLLSQRPASSTAVIAIDEESIRQVGRWPWPRTVIAQIVNRAADAGARGVILDILLPDASPEDETLARALHRLPAVAVCVLVERDEWLLPAPALRSAAVAAHGNFELDHDGILRRFASTKQNRSLSLTALSLEAAAIAKSAPIPVGQSIAPEFRTRPRSIPTVSAIDVLRGTASAALHGRLLFIGPTALGLGDRVLTPVSSALLPDPGVTVHAAATESLLRNEVVRELAPIVAGLLAGIAAAAVLMAPSRLVRFIVALALMALVIGGGAWLLAGSGVAVPFVTLGACIIGATAAMEANVMMASLRRSREAATRLESGLGMPSMREADPAPRLEEIATRLAEHRAREVESKRLLAHELRTPLASMRGLTQLLAGYDLNDVERRRVATLLETEAGKLQSMVNALLDLERLPLRDFDTTSAVVDLGQLVNDRINFLQASTDRKLLASVAKGLTVRADASLIERVVDNLVGNALKYSPAPTPVRVAVRGRDGDALLEVEDHGPGIDAAERDRIFQRFFRGSTAAGTDGLGLGLSLVSEVAKWHGGSVSLDRASDGGSLFRFALPLHSVARAGAM